MNFRDIALDDKPLFDGLDYICSDYIFSYVFMYCEEYKLKIYDDSKTIIIHSGYNKPSYYMPLGDTEHGVKTILEYCSKNNTKPVFTKIPESHVALFKDFKFKIKEDRNSFDYIFRNSDLAEYNGKDFRKQRNNLASYLKISTPEYTEDIREHIIECKEFTLKHFDKVDIIHPTLRMLDNLDRFNCSGGMVWNEGKLQAFCVYEKVSNDTVLSHIELTDNSHRGIHTYMISEMSKSISEEYINKEDDLGLSGLRRFKETYNPCTMLKKYIACIE